MGRMRLLCARGVVLALAGTAIASEMVGAQEIAAHTLERDGLKLEMEPLAIDQVRAFFLARGFSSNDVEFLAETGCVFRSAIGSAYNKAGDPDVSLTLIDWQVSVSEGVESEPLTREHWEAVWTTRSANPDAATAFYWALFPTSQTFAPTDYNWGMLTFGLSPGTRFNLLLRWRTSGHVHEAHMEDLECGK